MTFLRAILGILLLSLSSLRADSWTIHGLCTPLLSSNTAGFVGWSQIDGSITPSGGAIAPNGVASARFVEGAALDSDHLVFFEGTPVTPGRTYQYSVYTKAVLTSPNVRLAKMQLADGPYSSDIDGFFDNRNGTIFFITPPTGPALTLIGSGFIYNLGNGWYRIGFNFSTTATTVNILIGQATSGGNGTYDGDGSSATDYWIVSVCGL